MMYILYILIGAVPLSRTDVAYSLEKGFLNIDEIWNDDSVGKKTTFLPHESPLLLI